VGRSGSSEILGTRNALLAGVCTSALAIAFSIYPASAATYLVSNETQLRNAITTANADGDPNAVIRMTAVFSIGAAALPVATKPMTIDTQGFTSEPLNLTGSGGPVTITGTFQGASAGTGERGLGVANGAFVINDGSVTGGDGGGSSTDGLGVGVSASTLVNNGIIRGGKSDGGARGGLGAQIGSGSSLVNNGLIEGGEGQGVRAVTVFFLVWHQLE
jgi:hypothetical protein